MTRSGMISSSSRPRKDCLSKRFNRDRIHYFDLCLDLHMDLETIQRKFCFKIVKFVANKKNLSRFSRSSIHHDSQPVKPKSTRVSISLAQCDRKPS